MELPVKEEDLLKVVFGDSDSEDEYGTRTTPAWPICAVNSSYESRLKSPPRILTHTGTATAAAIAVVVFNAVGNGSIEYGFSYTLWQHPKNEGFNGVAFSLFE